ncbi:MAG: PilN domain-containing protein [Candidatus Saccharimonadales bacterium]
MINLLPPTDKKQIQAARANTLLFRYALLSAGVLVFLLAAIAFTYFFLTTTKSGAEQTIEESKSRVADYTAVKVEADQFRTKLQTAKQILDREVTYTSVILEISRLLPSGVVLTQLNLDASTFGTPTTLSIQAKNYQTAIALKDSFQASKLFSDVHFESIATSSDSGGYPLTVTLGVTIAKEASK